MLIISSLHARNSHRSPQLANRSQCTVYPPFNEPACTKLTPNTTLVTSPLKISDTSLLTGCCHWISLVWENEECSWEATSMQTRTQVSPKSSS